jgi:hypothetical protein
MSPKLKRRASCVLAIASGAMMFMSVAASQADDDKEKEKEKTVTLCYRSMTIVVEKDEVKDYLEKGATKGACQTSPP